MDLQALTFVKMTEHQSVRFDPDKEDRYYEAAVELPRFVGATCTGVSRTITWLRATLHSGRRSPGRIGKPKATTG